ncbi:MAG: pilus assembly protein TadG-related protein [bacterium]
MQKKYGRKIRRLLDQNRGSFLVAGVVFTMIFMLVAGVAVDAGRYLAKTHKWQQIADNAAIAGAQSLNQYTDDPELSYAYDSVLDYIEDKLGAEYRELYEVSSPTEVEGI